MASPYISVIQSVGSAVRHLRNVQYKYISESLHHDAFATHISECQVRSGNTSRKERAVLIRNHFPAASLSPFAVEALPVQYALSFSHMVRKAIDAIL
jgi:hypothetical protein